MYHTTDLADQPALVQFPVSDPLEEKRERLAEIILAYSYDDTETTLSSGERADYYFNLKPTMLDPEGANLLSELMLEPILTAGASVFGGLELGAVPIIGAIARHSHTYQPPLQGLIVRKATKGHGTDALIEGLRPGQDLTGVRVAVVEDVATSGASIMQAVDAFRALGADVVLALTVIDRGAGAFERCREAGIPLESIFTADELRSLA